MDSCITSPRWPVIVNVFPAAHLARFDEDDVAAHRRSKTKADGNSRLLAPALPLPFPDAPWECPALSRIHLGRNDQLVRLGPPPKRRACLANQRGRFSRSRLRTPAFPRVVADELMQKPQSVNSICSPSAQGRSPLAWRAIRNIFAMWTFFLFRVSGKLDDLHAVAQKAPESDRSQFAVAMKEYLEKIERARPGSDRGTSRFVPGRATSINASPKGSPAEKSRPQGLIHPRPRH